MNTNNREILQIALPSIVSNITVPLLGLIDVTIVGHLGAASYIGAIAVGGMLFNIIYWIFGFLRMGTSGMTSQAYGRKDKAEMMRLLTRSTGVGLLIALTLLVLQYPIEQIAFTFIETTPEVQRLAPILVTLLPISIDCNESHQANAQSPILVTLSGISMLFNKSQR